MGGNDAEGRLTTGIVVQRRLECFKSERGKRESKKDWLLRMTCWLLLDLV